MVDCYKYAINIFWQHPKEASTERCGLSVDDQTQQRDNTSKNLPVSIIEDSLFPDFSKHDEAISIKTLKGVIFKLPELVEKRNAKEMKLAGMGSVPQRRVDQC